MPRPAELEWTQKIRCGSSPNKPKEVKLKKNKMPFNIKHLIVKNNYAVKKNTLMELTKFWALKL